ncbi:unnamed protein product [Polarella glacialis]|uniref:Uncharacterized protein n=1 Tax=Polarella glacialis TaxID=89957 RepID=A0A813LLE0_POLGL|nr:unnamed protein product [Polarella glacialis]
MAGISGISVPGAKVTSIPCVTSIPLSVATLKKKFSKTGIDVLFNCADVMALTDRATAEQERHSLQLVHFVLTAELRPLLELATLMRGRARVVTVKHSSVAPEMPSKQLDAACLGNNNGNNNSNNNSNKNNSNNTRIKVVVFALGMGGRITTSSCKVKCVGVSVGFDPTTTNNDILYLTNKLKDAMPSTCKVKSVCAAPGFDATTNDKNKNNNNNKQVTRNSQDAMPSTWTRKSAPSAQELKLESICPKPETVKI